MIITSLVASVSFAGAAAPVSVDGWRYVEGPNELHVYLCDRADCVPGSRVFLHFEPPNSPAFPGISRKWEAAVSDILGEQGKTVSSLTIDLSTGRARNIATASDGSKAYYVFGDVDGPKWRASLSSSSSDEEISESNLRTFESALKGVKN
jgi:hypothetical protein